MLTKSIIKKLYAAANEAESVLAECQRTRWVGDREREKDNLLKRVKESRAELLRAMEGAHKEI